MVRNILVSMVSQQVDTEGQTCEMTFATEGKYYEKAGYRYITYQESKVTGLEGTTTYLKLGHGHVAVIRMGSVEAKQVFAVGNRHHSSYITPYGVFEIVVNPWVVEDQVCAGEGYVRLEYDLEMEGKPCSRNSLMIKVQNIEGSGDRV